MSFNSLLCLALLLTAVACGVKSNPIAPKDSGYPSYDTKFHPKPTPTPKKSTSDNE